MLVYKVADLAIKHDVNSSADMTNEGAPYEDMLIKPDVLNSGGWFMLAKMEYGFQFLNYQNRALKAKILSDLIAAEIGRRINQPISLKDVYSNGPYQYNTSVNCLFSVGPDRKPYTDDDISLVSANKR